MIKIYDNGGETIDRYTLVDESENAIYGLSENPFSPQGFNQYCGPLVDELGAGKALGDDEIRDLSREVLAAIVTRLI